MQFIDFRRFHIVAKASITFATPVLLSHFLPSVRMYQSGFHLFYFCEIKHWSHKKRSAEKKIQILVRTGQKYRALYMKTGVCVTLLSATCVAQQYKERIAVFPLQRLRHLLHC